MTGDWFHTVTVGTRMGDAARDTDWAATPLGPPDAWPEALRSAVTLCFGTRFPTLLAWGPELTMLYNDGFQTMLGTERARWALGARLEDVWVEIWDTAEPLIYHAVNTGKSTWTVSEPLVIYRSEFLEEAHFTASFSALRDDDGSVGGILCIASEVTDEVVDRRRLQLLSELAATLGGIDGDVTAILRAAARLLTDRPDIASTDLYIRDGDRVALVASTDAGPTPERILAARVVTTLRSRTPRVRDRILVAPLTGVRGGDPVGFVVVRASDLRPFDDSYQSFLRLVAQAIGTAAAGAAERRREVNQVRGISDALQRAMLPAQPSARGWYTRYRPADGSLAVGGDWYDVVELGSGRWGLLVGDCVGHGLAAAALMGQLRSAGRALLLERNGPAGTLEGLDRFARTLPGAEFTTVFCGIVDEVAGTLTYASAGHPPGLRVGPCGTAWLDEVPGLPLTLGDQVRIERTIPLAVGDVIVLYTDGLVERRQETLAVGLDRLARTTERILASRGVTELADVLLASLATGARDDVALVVYSRGDRLGA